VGNHYKKISFALSVLLLACSPLFGQSDSSRSQLAASTVANAGLDDDHNGGAGVPDAPSASKAETTGSPEASPTPVRKDSQQGAPPAAMGPDWAEVHRTLDREYWEVTGSLFALSIANAELAQRCLHQLTCTWVPTAFRGRAAMYGAGLSADAGISYFSYRLKRKRKSLWFLPSAAATALNAYVAVHDYRRLR